MAINNSLNAIINEIQLSKLNFMVNVTVTPFAAYIIIQKTTILDKNGLQAFPTPPSLQLLEDTRRDKFYAEKEIGILIEALLTLLNGTYFYYYLTRGGVQSSPPPQIDPKIRV